MIAVQINLKDFERKAKELEASRDQVPFALARAMNDAAMATRKKLVVETWPRHITMRNTSFLNAALHTTWATKYNLTVMISNQGGAVPAGRGHLAEHADGGVKHAAKGNLAIPLKSWARYTARGITKSQLPANIIATTPKRALRITKDGIFVGEGGRLHLRYSLKPSVTIKPDVPFHEDFNTSMVAEINRAFPKRLAEAMATKR